MTVDLYGESSLCTVLHELLADRDVELAGVIEVEDSQLSLSGKEVSVAAERSGRGDGRWNDGQVGVSPEHVLAKHEVGKRGRESGGTLDRDLEEKKDNQGFFKLRKYMTYFHFFRMILITDKIQEFCTTYFRLQLILKVFKTQTLRTLKNLKLQPKGCSKNYRS